MTGRIVVSGAPGTGKSGVAALLGEQFDLPVLSLDLIKEALADSLGVGDEAWSDRLGDAAAEVLFRLVASFPGSIAEGWWRGARRERAIDAFTGWTEVFCRCAPDVVEQRMRERAARVRHPIHRDVINPTLLDDVAALDRSVAPLHLGGPLIEVDTTGQVDATALVAAVRVVIHD